MTSQRPELYIKPGFLFPGSPAQRNFLLPVTKCADARPLTWYQPLLFSGITGDLTRVPGRKNSAELLGAARCSLSGVYKLKAIKAGLGRN